MHNSTTKQENSIANFLVICIAVATLLNGINFWLTKGGFINRDLHQQLLQDRNLAYENLIKEYQREHALDPASAQQSLNEKRSKLNLTYSNKMTEFYRSSPGLLKINKIIKYLVIAGLLVYCLLQIFQGKATFNSNTILITLLIYTSILGIVSWTKYGLITLLPGVLFFSFAIIALIGMPLIQQRRYSFLIKTLLVTVLIFVIFTPIEIIRHVQLFGSPWANYRISGFMNLPNSMGIYLLCIYCLVSNYYLRTHNFANPRHLLFLIMIVLGIMASGSYTAIVTFFIFIFMVHYQQLVKSPIVLIGFVCIALITFVLISAKSDHSLFLSISGRVYKFNYYLGQQLQLTDILFGQGIGYSSNLLINLSNYFQIDKTALLITADSTPFALLMQTGIIGIVLVYGLIIYAAVSDTSLRPVYIVFLICTLTINLFEVFPLNVILGIILAKSLCYRAHQNEMYE